MEWTWRCVISILKLDSFSLKGDQFTSQLVPTAKKAKRTTSKSASTKTSKTKVTNDPLASKYVLPYLSAHAAQEP